jgi:branched-chain amino acid transport system ATP-binding protein
VTETPLVDVRGIGMRFGGLKAVDDVSFAVEPSHILGLVGPNGSGKSTVLNVLSGVYVPDEGEVCIAGRRMNGASPSTITKAGLGRTFQNLQLFHGLNLVENVLTGTYHRQKASVLGTIFGSPVSRREALDARREAADLLARVGLAGREGDAPATLSYGQRRLLEVARALATRPRVLMLDEPCAGLSQGEADALAALVRDLAGGGMAIIVIEHNMRFVMNLVERLVVLNQGRKIAEGTPEEIRSNPEVIVAYLGKSLRAQD